MASPRSRDTSPIYALDIEKLWNAIDSKRRSDKLSWGRLSQRLGLAKNSLSSMTRPTHGKPKIDVYTKVFINALIYLNRPYTDFIKETKREIYDDANGS